MKESANSVSADERIIAAVRGIVTDSFQPGLRSLVLTGSLARDEGTWLRENGRDRLAGDAEFLAVFGEHDALPSPGAVAAVERAVENRLYESGLEVHIGISPVGPRYLRRLRPHIFAYELLEHGRVICGDENILALAPRFSSAYIPLEDGFRLLMNRIIELLEALCSPRQESFRPLGPTDAGMRARGLSSSESLLLTRGKGEPALRSSATNGPSGGESFEFCSEAVHYRAMKLWLDMATSFLLFQGQYEPTYRQRAERLAQMASLAEAGSNGSVHAPIPLRRFAGRVSLATAYKLGTAKDIARISLEDLRSLIEDAHLLWRWQLGRLTGVDGSADDNELLEGWLKSQELAGRIRGWAATAKRYGLWRSAGMVPRWVRLGLKGSPRRLIYAAACEVFFGLNSIVSANGHSLSREEMRTAQAILDLPVASKCEAEDSWQDVGGAVAWNYHQFLESTRS